MTDYTELVKALRGKFIAYDVTGNHNSAQLYKGAAAAIEALQAQLPKQGEIVRCGECKYWMDIDDGRQKHEMCAQLMPNWFCADGERKVQE